MEKTSDGRIFAVKGDVLPFLCPQCDSIIPFTPADTQHCSFCDYEGPTIDFEIEWELSPPQ